MTLLIVDSIVVVIIIEVLRAPVTEVVIAYVIIDQVYITVDISIAISERTTTIGYISGTTSIEYAPFVVKPVVLTVPAIYITNGITTSSQTIITGFYTTVANAPLLQTASGTDASAALTIYESSKTEATYSYSTIVLSPASATGVVVSATAISTVQVPSAIISAFSNQLPINTITNQGAAMKVTPGPGVAGQGAAATPNLSGNGVAGQGGTTTILPGNGNAGQRAATTSSPSLPGGTGQGGGAQGSLSPAGPQVATSQSSGTGLPVVSSLPAGTAGSGAMRMISSFASATVVMILVNLWFHF